MLERWESVLTRLERDPFECADELDWVAKLKLLNSYRDRDGLAWSDAKLHLIDLQYADLRPEKGLYHRLLKLGRMKRLVDDTVVEEAMHEPPEDTRAYFRGRCLSKYADNIAAASWDSVIFDLPGHESLQRVPTIDPLRGSKAHVGALLDQPRHRAGAVRGAHPPLSQRRHQSLGQVPVDALAEGRLLGASSGTSAVGTPAVRPNDGDAGRTRAASRSAAARSWRTRRGGAGPRTGSGCAASARRRRRPRSAQLADPLKVTYDAVERCPSGR